ncbi:MAG: SDR family oxidoreductase [Desulfovibrionaceae bacterium]|nr:SDR family oxidoreductase [Desulfovibrionaceae bacterium]MBF0513274.1 SDR family oxidoreductase [Desulfovibrionaceae bacterium]
MDMTGNTILITGGGSGIGKALAVEFHKLGNRVIVAGRRQAALDAVTAANPGMQSAVVDLQDPAALDAFAATVASEYPSLNALFNNAGVMKPENLLSPDESFAVAEATVATNLLAPMRLTKALLPVLLKQDRATILNVSSGLAFLPLAMTPTYSATKAAIHSYSQSLRYQLKGAGVEVLELAPPYVATELMGAGQLKDPRAMPLTEFIAQVMEILSTQPQATEILVKNVYPLRFAEEQGHDKYETFFATFNDAMTGH